MALGDRAIPRRPYPVSVTRIERLAELDPGWNGHNAPRIPEASRAAAVSFLERVWSEFGSSVPEPTVVAATSDEGVALEWIVKDGDRERGVEIVCLPARYEYSVRNRQTGRLEQDAEGIAPQQILFDVIKPYVAGHFVLAK